MEKEENSKEESHEIGCGALIIELIVSVICIVIFWDKITELDYYPYLIVLFVVSWIVVILWHLSHN